jgi:hypothetical protein
MDFHIEVPYLDECGQVYLAGCGRNGSCLRLNPRASDLWRRLARDEIFPTADETDADRAFLDVLVRAGAIKAS